MAGLVGLLWCLTLIPLVACTTLSSFDLRADSSSSLHVERRNFVQKTVPLSGLHEELDQLRLRRSFDGQPTNHPFSLNDELDTALILYSGTDQKVIFILTFPSSTQSTPIPIAAYHTNLYRSTDYGYSYTRINSKLEPNNTENLMLLNQFFVSPEDNKQIVFPHYVDSVMYVTTDEGDNFVKISMDQYGINPRFLVFHPRDGRTFLAFNGTYRNLYVSHDLGSSFSLVASSVFNYHWGVPGYDKDVSTIFYRAGSSTASSYLYQISDKPSSIPAQFDPNLGPIGAFIVVNEYIFALKSGPSLWISYNRQPFKQALISSGQSVQGYLVAAIPDVMALVVTQKSNGIHDLHTSDTEGHYFSLSLSDIYVNDLNVIDLELVDSMNFTFIANQNVRSGASTADPARITLISFNNAGVWEPIIPPQRYYNGSLVSCEPPSCSLHFHMASSDYARVGVYSQESAPGIIIAHGTIGEKLTDNPDLFLSQDGGVTWIMTLESSWGVSVLDHGGLLVAARDYHHDPSNTLMYSCDEGFSWSSYKFYDLTLTIYGVVTEPGETTTVVQLFGTETIQPLPTWEIVLVNFSQIFERVCTPQDYYFWSPYDEHFNTECLLGASLTIERRLPSVCCLNGLDYERSLNYTTCPCTVEDFECDFGYIPSSIGSGACVRDHSVTVEDHCTAGQETYMQSQGYRKIPGDACTDGEEALFAKIQTKCCLAPVGNESTPTPVPAEGNALEISTIILGVFLLLAILVIIILLVSFLIVVCKVAKKRSDGYQRVERLAFHAVDSGSSLPAYTDEDDNTDEDDTLLNA